MGSMANPDGSGAGRINGRHAGAVRSMNEVDSWVFDLDNTLYPRSCDLFAQIDTLITRYMMDLTGMDYLPARKLQKDYYRDHGTTLNGLMIHYDIDPDHYLSTVHDIDYSPVRAHPELVARIRNLPGKKYIFTNADTRHAEAVLSRLGGLDLFEGMFDIKAAGYVPKPEQSAYDSFLQTHGVTPGDAIMFDDLEKNLKVPHEMGMITVHVVAHDDYEHDQVDDWELERPDDAEHVHHVTQDLVSFLDSLDIK